MAWQASEAILMPLAMQSVIAVGSRCFFFSWFAEQVDIYWYGSHEGILISGNFAQRNAIG